MSRKLHLGSFGLGVASGALVLALVFGSMHLLQPQRQRGFGGQNGGPNITRMAERLGMTEADLQKELDSGKTMPQIAQEHGVQFGGGQGGGFGRGNGNGGGGFPPAGSGAAMSAPQAMTQSGTMQPVASSSSSAR